MLAVALIFCLGFVAAESSASAAGDLDCSDFGTRGAAQHEFEKQFAENGDVYNLDADGDGQACERNAKESIWTIAGSVGGVLLGAYALSPAGSTVDSGDVFVSGILAVLAAAAMAFAGPNLFPRGFPAGAYLMVGAAIGCAIQVARNPKVAPSPGG